MAQNMGQLIGFRAVQGLGAGGLMVGVMAIIGDLIPPRERGKYQGMMAGVMALAMIGGPLVGGTITDHLGWRWTFYINLPLGARRPRDGHHRAAPAEEALPGRGSTTWAPALLTVGITAIVLVTTWGGTQYAWGSAQIIGLPVLGVVALVGFVFVETRAAEPIMPLHIFRSRNFSLIVGHRLPDRLRDVRRDALPAAVPAVRPGRLRDQLRAAAAADAAGDDGRLAGRRPGHHQDRQVQGLPDHRRRPDGRRPVSCCRTMDVDTTRLISGVYMAVLGAGMGFLMQITMLVAQNSVEMKDMGVASSSTTLFRTLGGSFGVAIMGALFTSQVQDEMAQRTAQARHRRSRRSWTRRAWRSCRRRCGRPTSTRCRPAHTAFPDRSAGGIAVVVVAFFVKEVPCGAWFPRAQDGAKTVETV